MSVLGRNAVKFIPVVKRALLNKVPRLEHPSPKKKAHTSTASKPEARDQGSPKKPKEEEEEDNGAPGKKLRMKTATEVISRILWDPDLPVEAFTVGYLDRFVGIQEKPFKDFSWDDIASVGNNVLAVPKHRIQYFKYKDIIVWDKRTQVDNFFGSRGGKTIQDILDNEGEKPSEPLQPGEPACAEVEPTLLEAEVQEGQQVTRHYSDHNRPTHFICIRIDDEAVKAKVKEITDHITQLSPQLSEGLINLPALHVTLCMARLTTDEQIEKAKAVLESCRLQFISLLPRCVRLQFTGVDNFRERLIYVKVKPEPALSKFVTHLIEQLQGAGLRTPGNHDEYTPHITICKLSRPMQRDLDTWIINPACYRPYRNCDIGHQPVTCVHLCSMHAPAQEDGFYLRFVSLSNSLLGLPKSFFTLLENQIGLLGNLGYLSDQERDLIIKQLHSSIQRQDEGTFEALIKDVVKANKEAATFQSVSSDQPIVVIMRGLPGSGKSYLSSHCLEMTANASQSVVISADDYFTLGEEYQFNPITAYKAHQHCTKTLLDSLASGKKLAIIDNTNTQQWEYRLYTYLCDVLGYTCHILEIPCPSINFAEVYRSRNVHRIQKDAVARMVERWEKDERAVFVPPSLAYPRDWATNKETSYSILSLCQTPSLPNHIEECDSLVGVYVGLFLTTPSQWKLLDMFRPSHAEIYASHVTLIFEPHPSQLAKMAIGKRVHFNVIGQVDNGRIQIATVDLPKQVACHNTTPHITISTVTGMPPKTANTVLQASPGKHNSSVLTLEGTLGLVVREATLEECEGKEPTGESISQMSFHTLTAPGDVKMITPKLLEIGKPIPVEDKSEEVPGILSGDQKITQLFVFDFDGTLFIPPGPVEGKREYEKATGKKWPHRGWLGWPESLLPPLEVFPGPALADFRSHVDRGGSYTVLLTGRVEHTKPGVVKVLEDAQLYPQRIILKPDVTDERTSDFKLRSVKQLLQEFPDVTQVKFWDDLPDNLSAIKLLSQSKSGNNVQFELIDASEMPTSFAGIYRAQFRKKSPKQKLPPPKKDRVKSVLEEYLQSCGLLATASYQAATQEGLHFIATQFAGLTGYHGNPLNLVYTFGSHPLNRASDVDVCMIAPSTLTPIEWIEKLAKQFQSCAINYVHVGYSSRCPRLKILLQFSQTPSVEFDVLVSVIPPEAYSKLPYGAQLCATKISELRRAGDDRVALSGALFREKLEQSIDNVVSLDMFGAVVEMTVQLLIAKREKGNAYHCTRTFHIVQLLLEYLQTTSSNCHGNCDDIFKGFVNYVADLSFEKWVSLFKEIVLEEYIPRVTSLFKAASQVLDSEGHPSLHCYKKMLKRSEFPPSSYTPVEIRISGSDSVLKWKAGMLVEARLPSYIRQLVSVGLNVAPDGNTGNRHRYCFAVPSLKSTKDLLQQTLRPLWKELSEFRKQSGMSIHLTLGALSGGPSVTIASKDSIIASVMEQINTFADSPSNELHLSSSLTAHARLLVHEAAERLALEHTTSGSGKNRHIVLRKH